MTTRILVVDDEPDMEALLVQKFRRQISEGSVELLFARDGVEALDLLASSDAMDMVIADINMPRMDGLTLLQKLQGQQLLGTDLGLRGLHRAGALSHTCAVSARSLGDISSGTSRFRPTT